MLHVQFLLFVSSFLEIKIYNTYKSIEEILHVSTVLAVLFCRWKCGCSYLVIAE